MVLPFGPVTTLCFAFSCHYHPKTSSSRSSSSSGPSHCSRLRGKTKRTTSRSSPMIHRLPPLALSFQKDTSEPVQCLYQFLETEECEGMSSLAIGWTTHDDDDDDDASSLRGLFALEDFNQGEFLCAIPFPSTLLVQEKLIDASSDNDGHDNDDENANDDDGDSTIEEELAQAMAFLKKFVANEHWKPYIDCLPRGVDDPSFAATPDFWTAEALERFPVPRLRQMSLQRRQRIQKQATKQSNDSSLSSLYTAEELQWAMWIIRSRGFTTLKDIGGILRERTILLPLMDMINHDANAPNAVIEVIEANAYDESFVALQAQSPITAGEQITLQYGTGFETSLELLDKYGFWIDEGSSSLPNPNNARINWDLVDMGAMLENAKRSDVVGRFCKHLKRHRPTR